MRHRVPGNKLGRPADQRKAVLRSLATELLRHDEIMTTLGKAKAVRSEAEKMITLAKHGRFSGERWHEKAKQGDKDAAAKLAKHVPPRRQMSGYIYDADVVARAYDVL